MLPLTVLICTYNREKYLNLALKSLCTQTLPVDQYEVIIIDDGSKDHTAEVVESYKKILPLKYIYQKNSGLAAAKNSGLDEAMGEIVFFFDDDDAAAPNLLQEHLKTHKQYPEEYFAVLNYTTWSPRLEISFFMHFLTEVDDHLFSYQTIKNGDVLDYTFFWGGRSSCKISFLNKYGKFNSVFRFGCEDIELGYRLSKHGLKVVYNANAVSYMTRPVMLKDFIDRLLKQGRSQAVFSEIHPGLEVRKWCEIDSIVDEWGQIEPVYDLAVHSALQLEKITNEKTRLGLPIDALTVRLFYQSLWNVFRATKVKGMIEQKNGKFS